MEVDAARVHRLHALVDHNEALVECVGDVLRAQQEANSGTFQRRAFFCAVLGEEREPLFGIPVSVNVYGGHQL